MTTLHIPVGGIGLRAPGIINVHALLQSSDEPREEGHFETPKGQGLCLPATERRRATPVTRLALDAAMEATSGVSDPSLLTTLFASSGGEVTVIHQIFDMLAQGDTALSPTAFHNSVHNAAAGYWSIASGSQYPADSICAYDDSFGAGLADAALRYLQGERNILLIAYDLPPPYPISEKRHIRDAIAAALLLGYEGASPIATLSVNYDPKRNEKPLPLSHPSAPLVAIIRAIAKKAPHSQVLSAGFGGTLTVEVRP